MEHFLRFLNRLEEEKIYYRLNKVREEAVMAEIAVPGERWEVEFMEDGSVQVERFVSADGVSGCVDMDHCPAIFDVYPKPEMVSGCVDMDHCPELDDLFERFSE